MFYSETLLAKTGPLARVWLAANLERKLTKQNVLSSNLENNVKDIIGTGQAPMALRLSGQLLLGVVKIYSRKARYLMDDASEALGKLKMAFRPGNVDLTTNPAHANNPAALILPDAVTELDLFAPLPDPEELLRDDSTILGPGRDPTLLDFGTSQLLPESQTPSSRREKRTIELDDIELDIDFGPESNDHARSPQLSEERSIEIGRRAPTPRRDEPTLLDDDNLGIDFGFGGEDTTLNGPAVFDNDMPMLDVNNDDYMAPIDDNLAAAIGDADAAARRQQRDSASPLSDLRPSAERDLERTFQLGQGAMDETDETMVQAAQRVKRRKVMRQDEETQLAASQMKRQLEDRSKITKAPTFLERDPVLLQLMELQRQGKFVSNIMGDGRMAGWAPELRGILSLEVVRQAGEKKRKRDSGIADMDNDSPQRETPQIEIPPEDEHDDFPVTAGADFAADATLPHSDGIQPLDDALAPAPEDEEPYPAFDQTEIPLLHPSQTGPVSLGTKNAVHLLREYFAPDHPRTSAEPPTPSKRVKGECLFTDLCPEKRTRRDDATKMFFELLVLGTKDAVKVEQDAKTLGGPIRVRGKRGLWGDWAERGAGGEIASQGAPAEPLGEVDQES